MGYAVFGVVGWGVRRRTEEWGAVGVKTRMTWVRGSCYWCCEWEPGRFRLDGGTGNCLDRTDGMKLLMCRWLDDGR